MRTHLFSTAITTKAAVTAATVVLIGGGAALAETHDGTSEPEPEVEEPLEVEIEEEDDEGDAYALGRDDGDQEARTTDFCETEESGSPRCGDDSTEEEEVVEEGVEAQDELETEGEGERSATAQAVHEVLGGGNVSPGEEGFGEAVSSRAKDKTQGPLGHDVSDAARGANPDPAGGEEGPEASQEEEGAGTSEDDEDDDLEPAEAGGPPNHAKAHGRG